MPSDFETGLNNLILRAHRAEAEATNEINYLEKLEQFISISKELREAFRSYVTRQASPPPLPYEDRPEIAKRFAPQTRAEQLAASVVDQINGYGTH